MFIFLETDSPEKAEALPLYVSTTKEMQKMRWSPWMAQSWMVENFVFRWRGMGDPLSLKDEVHPGVDTEEEGADTVVGEGRGPGPDLVLGTGAAGGVAIPEVAAGRTTAALAPRVAARVTPGADPGRTPGSRGPTPDLDLDLKAHKKKRRRMEQND